MFKFSTLDFKALSKQRCPETTQCLQQEMILWPTSWRSDNPPPISYCTQNKN
uniref:Uncharacterized protein n=1 Tax=Octopus bimaculoides TaxID=37653 RepID=A0A0L8IG99_OCTBM